MHILITNDDGIFAPGLAALAAEALSRGHKVSACAPDGERSAASHSITLRRNIHVKPVALEGVQKAYAADGTPADCARLGLYLIRDVDLVISGINNGPNMGGACIYSGTVAAATEAAMSGKPALAVSYLGYGRHDYAASAKLALDVAEWMPRHPLPLGVVYSLNVPDLPLKEIRGVAPASLAETYMDEPYYREIEGPEGTEYAYGHGKDQVPGMGPGTDVTLTMEGWASLSILSWNLQGDGALPDLGDLPRRAPLEIERKYLIARPEEAFLAARPGAEVWRITQTYLEAPEGETRRVRRLEAAGGVHFFRAVKRRVGSIACEEDEAEISADEYERLLREADGARRPIEKTRVRIPWQGHTLEVDLYPFWQRQAVLEVELGSEDEAVLLPDWLRVLREVSGDRRYSNAELARQVPREEET